MADLTDADKDILAAWVYERCREAADQWDELVTAVESIVRAARAQELRDAADSVGDDWFEHRLQLNLMGIRSWLRDRANHIESSNNG